MIKEAFAAGILSEGQQWIDMIEHRNLMPHTYNRDILLEAIDAIQRRYQPQLEQLRQWLNERKGT